jgi:hypothetical protein
MNAGGGRINHSLGVDVEDEDVEVVVAVFSVKEFEQQEES